MCTLFARQARGCHRSIHTTLKERGAQSATKCDETRDAEVEVCSKTRPALSPLRRTLRRNAHNAHAAKPHRLVPRRSRQLLSPAMSAASHVQFPAQVVAALKVDGTVRLPAPPPCAAWPRWACDSHSTQSTQRRGGTQHRTDTHVRALWKWARRVSPRAMAQPMLPCRTWHVTCVLHARTHIQAPTYVARYFSLPKSTPPAAIVALCRSIHVTTVPAGTLLTRQGDRECRGTGEGSVVTWHRSRDATPPRRCCSRCLFRPSRHGLLRGPARSRGNPPPPCQRLAVRERACGRRGASRGPAFPRGPGSPRGAGHCRGAWQDVWGRQRKRSGARLQRCRYMLRW